MDLVGKSYVNGRRDGSQLTTFYLISSASSIIYLNWVQHQSYNSVDINSPTVFLAPLNKEHSISHSDNKPSLTVLHYTNLEQGKQNLKPWCFLAYHKPPLLLLYKLIKPGLREQNITLYIVKVCVYIESCDENQ